MVEDKETLFAWLANALKDSPVDFLEVYVGDEEDGQVYVRFENVPEREKMKKYNSVAYLPFSIHHDREDGEDITPEMLREAFNNRTLTLSDQELWEACGGDCYDTIENEPLAEASA